MGKKTKKGTRGTAVNYLTRGQALNKLQVNLKTFRRLCILKGIHPREPRKKLHGNDKTYYHAKDMRWLMHEPLLDNFRRRIAHGKKIKRAVGRRNIPEARRLATKRPKCSMDHLVRERYPSFADALRDLDDPLTMVNLFSVLPSTANKDRLIPFSMVNSSRRLAMEFNAYVVRAHALRKIFVSVRGFYFQADIMGQTVTWLAPHTVQQILPSDIDYSVLTTFMEFYMTLLKFVNFKLYHSLGLRYPPPRDPNLHKGAAFLESIMSDFAKGELQDEKGGAVKAAPISEEARERLSGLKNKMQEIVNEVTGKQPDTLQDSMDEDLEEISDVEDLNNEGVNMEEDSMIVGSAVADKDNTSNDKDDEQASDVEDQTVEGEKAAGATACVAVEDDAALCKNLFRGLVFFLGRECPMQPLLFTIRAFGGKVGWEGAESPIQRADETITHEICDRPKPPNPVFDTREYLQPQWVLDCCNARVLLPIAPYAPGKAPPPHLSPFVDENEEGYVPEYAKTIQNIQEAANLVRRTMSAGDESGQTGAGAEDLELEQLLEIEEAEAKEKAYIDDLTKELGKENDTTVERGADKPKETKQGRKRTAADVKEETKAMSEIMIPKKHRYMYNFVKGKEKEKVQRIQKLQKKRATASRGQ